MRCSSKAIVNPAGNNTRDKKRKNRNKKEKVKMRPKNKGQAKIERKVENVWAWGVIFSPHP
jgi:hypothetical protein